jgi:hypothetical protein
MVVKVSRIFGHRERIPVRGTPDEKLFAKVKNIIDWQLKTNSFVLWQTGSGEARAELLAGRELASQNGVSVDYFNGWWDMDADEAARRRHNIQEAIRAFQTVLLLQPTNREAKIYLASCLRTWMVHRYDESLDYYRQIIDEPIQDRWTGIAQTSLHYSFPGGLEEKAKWFETAGLQTSNSPAAEYYRREAEQAEKDLISSSGGEKAREIAEKELLSNIMRNAAGNRQSPKLGADDFVDLYGTNTSAAGRRMLELYPELKANSSNAAPFVLAAVLIEQADTNAPVVAEFREFLDTYFEHSNRMMNPGNFWRQVVEPVCEWSFKHKLYGMAAKTIEGRIKYSKIDTAAEIYDEQKLALAYADMGLYEWQKALNIFETYSNRPVATWGLAPWGSPIVFTKKQASYCREKLGFPAAADPLEFDMGGPVQCMCTPSTFISDDKGLWVGIDGQLLRLSFDLQTNFVVRLPMSDAAGITSLALYSSNVWIGTIGEGLIKYDKSSGNCQRFTMKDGMMVDSISSLQVSGDILWIGYNKGIGFLDLHSGKFTSFTSSIAETLAPGVPAPRGQVRILAVGRPDEVWFSAEDNRVSQFRMSGSAWNKIPDIGSVSALAANENEIAVGQSWASWANGKGGSIGVTFLNFKDLRPRSMGAVDGLPPGSVTTMTMEGNNLWLGGFGYVALADVKQAKIRKYAYIKARSVNRIQIGGGYVWAQFDWHLYRAALRDLE